MDTRWRRKRLLTLHRRVQLMHPLLTDLSTLKDQEISNRISDLTKKYFMTRNADVQRQMAQVIDDLRYELSERNRKQWELQAQNGDKSLDKLINVN